MTPCCYDLYFIISVKKTFNYAYWPSIFAVCELLIFFLRHISFLFACVISLHIVVVDQFLSHIWLFVTPWTAACQASLSFTISQSLLKFMSIESVMPSNPLILCCPLLVLPSIFPSIRVFSNELARRIRWPKYCSFSFSISPSNEYQGLFPLGLTGLISLLS